MEIDTLALVMNDFRDFSIFSIKKFLNKLIKII